MNIEYKTGDLFSDARLSDSTSLIILPHVCNDLGAMGAGFVVPLCKRWPQVKTRYVNHCLYNSKMCIPKLGTVHWVWVEDNVYIANMIAQHGIGFDEKPIRYAALVKCMEEVANFAQKTRQIIAPKFGAGLAGGNWSFIEELIDEIWVAKNISVTIWSL